MSYDIHLMRFQGGESVSIDSASFWNLMASAWEEPPDEDGFVRLVRRDGEADVIVGQVGEALESVMISDFGGDEILELVYELAREADAVIIGPDLPPLLTRAEQRHHVPPALGLGEPVLISSGRDLHVAIIEG